ncbi:SDR family NAD(P)-dependent oxidoreductase [Hymenobacter glacieicola]|nr:SDR family NAD(P)-dependent oxidoreductase [Hymenobacter glacieicola]
MQDASAPMYIITGASRGIGQYLMSHFAAKGHKVIGIYNSTKPATLEEHCHQIDLTDEAAIMAFFQTIEPELKNVVLLNAAGITYNALAHKAELTAWRQVIDTNVVALFNLTKLLLPVMRQDNYGRIISFSSVVAQSGIVGTSAYAASKSALWGMAKAIAAENAIKNITINAINLGYFDIGMIDKVPANMLAGIVEKIPAKRLGRPEEIISAVEFMISNAYLNGTSVDLNGGLF